MNNIKDNIKLLKKKKKTKKKKDCKNKNKGLKNINYGPFRSNNLNDICQFNRFDPLKKYEFNNSKKCLKKIESFDCLKNELLKKNNRIKELEKELNIVKVENNGLKIEAKRLKECL